MSRIGNKIINISEQVKVEKNNQSLIVRGPKGELVVPVHPKIEVEIAEDTISVKRRNNDRLSRSLHGLTRTLIANAVNGVLEGFEKKLEFKGVGYRAAVEGNVLTLNVGFSHPVKFEAPDGITITTAKNQIIVSGINKEVVGEVAAKIRDIRKPEPYKGKGIRYIDEHIRRKAGKTAKTGGSNA